MQDHQSVRYEGVPNQDFSSALKHSEKTVEIRDQLNSLYDKIYQGEYSPSNFCPVAEPCLPGTTVFRVVLTTTFFMLGSQLKRDDNHHLIIVKLLWLITLSSHFYLFPPKTVRSLQKQLSFFFALRLFSSSMAYSLVTGYPFTYEFHAESQEHDILVNLFLTMVIALFVQGKMSTLRMYLVFQFSTYFMVLIALQVWFKTFDYVVFLHQLALFLSLNAFCQILSMRCTMDQEVFQATMSKHCEDISQELDEIRNKLEEESKESVSRSLNTSEVDDLVMKVKYLKFSLLQKEQEKTFLNMRPVFSNVRRRTYVDKKCKGVVSPLAEKKYEENLVSYGPSTDLKHYSSIPGSVAKDEVDMKWAMSTSDCDNLIKLILEKQVIMWYPEVLKSKENKVCQETAEFLKQHFTEVGNSLLQKNLSSISKKSSIVQSSVFSYSPWSNYLETNICSWNFDMPKFKELTHNNHIMEFGCAIFKKFNILKTLNTNPTVVASFLQDVEGSYLPNPYHNSTHGADVCNASGYFLTHNEFGSHFNELEISCLIISALVHDLGHPGLNNAFLVATMSTEALIYNDQSVLENFHTASFFKILQKPGSNILQNLSEKDAKAFRKLAINIILDTDLTKHFIILSKFKNTTEIINLAEESDRSLALSVALKAADVSHGAKDLALHKRWSRRVVEEFFYQGDKEIEFNIPVTPLCDRKCNIAKAQQGFLNFIVLPLFEAIDSKFFNDEMRKTVTQQIKINIDYWTEEIPKEEKGEKNFLKDTEKTLEEINEEAAK